MSLVTTAQLAERLPFDMSDEELREAEGALTDLSDQARIYGSPSWETPETTPITVLNLITRAAARHMKNYDGLLQSRAGDETLVWSDHGEDAGSASFTAGEKQLLRAAAGTGFDGLTSVPLGFDFPVKTHCSGITFLNGDGVYFPVQHWASDPW